MSCLGREHEELGKRGLTVLAISADDEASHGRFAKALSLPFQLLSDPELEVARRYGVYAPSTGGGYAMRSVFLIGEDGRIAFIDRDFAVPRTLAGSALERAIDALAPADADPLAELAELPEPERSGKRVLGELLLDVIAENEKGIEALLHPAYGSWPGTASEDAVTARRKFLAGWRRTFEREDFSNARLSSILDFDKVRVLERDAASFTALRDFGTDVRMLAAGLAKDDVLVVVRCRGLASDDGSKVLGRELALDLRKEGDAWRIVAMTGR